MHEHRREPRVTDPLIDIRGGWTAVYNLSMGGMSGVTLEPIEIGEERTFELGDRMSGRDWKLTGQVVWALPVDDDHTCLGIQWQDMDPDAREWLTRELGDS